MLNSDPGLDKKGSRAAGEQRFSLIPHRVPGPQLLAVVHMGVTPKRQGGVLKYLCLCHLELFALERGLCETGQTHQGQTLFLSKVPLSANACDPIDCV